jgi:DNA-binding winged helix-turn-helix (wHTH) protein
MPAVPPAGGYAFCPFQLDIRAKRVLRSGTPLPLTWHQFQLLAALVSRAAGEVISKEELIHIG